ncbi:MAG: histidine kinase [Nitrospirae bacterium]|nr:MAG: histidine kinase [Nitrospirota bacterium]
MKILIADDDPDARNILKLIIEMQGHEAIEASDGLQGLEKTKANRPDLIISDILMPKMDGFQFLREANSDKNLSAIPFVFYSSTYTGEEEIGLAFSSGADGFIVKPKSPEKFWEELNNILSKREEGKSKKTKPIKDEEYLKRYSHIVSVKLEEKVKELEKMLEERKQAEETLKNSEARYRNLIETSPAVIYSLSTENGLITSLNPAFETITGWPREEWINRPFAPIVHPDDLSVAMKMYQKILNGETPPLYELRILSKSGEYLTGEFTSAPQIENGKVTGEFGIVSNITERKKIEEKIFQISQDWEHTFNSITDMVTVHDKDWNIIRANKAAEKMLGLPFLEKTADTKCFKYYHGTEKPPEGCPSCQCLQTGKSALFEIFEPHLNMFIEIRAIPRFDSDNNLIGLIHVVRDITERKKTEEKLNQFLKDITKAKTEWEITFDNVTELIVLVDKDFRIVRCNKVFAEFSDKPINEIPGSKFTDIFPMGEQDAGYLAERIQKEESSEWMEVAAADRWFYLSHQPVMVPDSLFLYSVIIATDITALKYSQQKLIDSEAELKKRVKELEKFYEMAVGRELKMKEMKKEIKDLRENLSLYKTGN